MRLSTLLRTLELGLELEQAQRLDARLGRPLRDRGSAGHAETGGRAGTCSRFSCHWEEVRSSTTE